MRTAAEESLKGTPLANATIYMAGSASVLKDLQEGSIYELVDRSHSIALPHLPHHVDHD